MGKIQGQTQATQDHVSRSTSHCCCCCFSSTWHTKISRAFSYRCLLFLILGVSVFLSALFWLPLFHTLNSGFEADDAGDHAPVQASFSLQRPVSMLLSYTDRLAYDIFEEIGIPNTKVSIISMHPLASSNLTDVVFGVLPEPRSASIALLPLSILRSSLIELVLHQSNLSLTPSIFGQPSSFEVLKFPGGITVIPGRSAAIWMPQVLFNFTLNNSVSQIQENVDQLKDELRYGLHLRSYEDIYVQVTNLDGSTLLPPIIVQASVVSTVGPLSQERLKQLAEAINGSSVKNLGLDHSIFGKVKQIQLSSYLIDASEGSPSPSPCPSPSSSPSPSPSPSPILSEGSPYSAPPVSQGPAIPSAYPPDPSANNDDPSPCFYCDTSAPSESTFSPAPTPGNEPMDAPPLLSLSVSPSPKVFYGFSPREDQQSGKVPVSSMRDSSQVLLSSTWDVVELWREFLLGNLVDGRGKVVCPWQLLDKVEENRLSETWFKGVVSQCSMFSDLQTAVILAQGVGWYRSGLDGSFRRGRPRACSS